MTVITTRKPRLYEPLYYFSSLSSSSSYRSLKPDKTRLIVVNKNTFCETWYLPHSQIAYFSLRMRETAIFLLPVKNLTLPSCSSTPIFYKIKDFWRLGHKLHIFYCACAKRPYFYFRSKMWRHHRVSLPRFHIRRGNFGDTWTFKADIAFFIFAWIFRTSGAKIEIFRGEIWEGVWRYWPPN